MIKFIQQYSGEHPLIQRYRVLWRGLDAEKVATVSRNSDWDDLFQKTDLVIACQAIRLHNAAAGRYLDLAADVLEGTDVPLSEAELMDLIRR